MTTRRGRTTVHRVGPASWRASGRDQLRRFGERDRRREHRRRARGSVARRPRRVDEEATSQTTADEPWISSPYVGDDLETENAVVSYVLQTPEHDERAIVYTVDLESVGTQLAGSGSAVTVVVDGNDEIVLDSAGYAGVRPSVPSTTAAPPTGSAQTVRRRDRSPAGARPSWTPTGSEPKTTSSAAHRSRAPTGSSSHTNREARPLATSRWSTSRDSRPPLAASSSSSDWSASSSDETPRRRSTDSPGR